MEGCPCVGSYTSAQPHQGCMSQDSNPDEERDLTTSQDVF